jgi:hypothetical protein
MTASGSIGESRIRVLRLHGRCTFGMGRTAGLAISNAPPNQRYPKRGHSAARFDGFVYVAT